MSTTLVKRLKVHNNNRANFGFVIQINFNKSSLKGQKHITCRCKDFATFRFRLDVGVCFSCSICVCCWWLRVTWQTSHEDDIFLSPLFLGQDPWHDGCWVLTCPDNKLVVPVHPPFSSQWQAAHCAMRIWICIEKRGAALVAELVSALEAEENQGCTFAIGPADTTFDVHNNVADRNRGQPNLGLVLVLIFTQNEISFLCIDFGQDVIYTLLLNFIK